ncbi:MAG: hypothetical protein JWQ70_2480 [Aeromicrobium sp.]|nr:hypothetical protein [Aeromicrobium sp.]
MVARLAESHREIGLVAQVNIGLTYLLVWSWTARDLDTCARVLDVMELAVVDTEDDDYAPVYNSVAIGMVEHVHRDLYMPDDFAAFVETWPPVLRERGLVMAGPGPYRYAVWDDEGPDEFRIPLRLRARLAVRHPIRTLRRSRRYLG